MKIRPLSALYALLCALENFELARWAANIAAAWRRLRLRGWRKTVAYWVAEARHCAQRARAWLAAWADEIALPA